MISFIRETTTRRDDDEASDGTSRDTDDARGEGRCEGDAIAKVAGDHAAHGASESGEESRGEKGAAAAGGGGGGGGGRGGGQ